MVGNLPEGVSYLWWGVRELFLFLTTIFPGCPCSVAGLEFFPIGQRCSHDDYAVVLWDTRVGTCPDIWNQENPASTVASPQLKFRVWIWKALILGLRSRSDSLGGADPRAQGRLPRLAGSTGLLGCGPFATATTTGHCRGAGMVGEGSSRQPNHFAPRLPGRAHCSPRRQRWPAGRSNPGTPTRGCTRRPAAGLHSPAPRRDAPPAPGADSEFSPPWLHN